MEVYAKNILHRRAMACATELASRDCGVILQSVLLAHALTHLKARVLAILLGLHALLLARDGMREQYLKYQPVVLDAVLEETKRFSEQRNNVISFAKVSLELHLSSDR